MQENSVLYIAMSKERAYQGLLLPGDYPPTTEELKRQLLFFDSIALASPHDKALINDGEITENFPGMTIRWADYAKYATCDGYDEQYREILEHADTPIRRGMLRVLPPRENNPDNAGINLILYHCAISESKLVQSAIPDLSAEHPLVSVPDTILSGGLVKQSGHRSRYELPVNDPAHLPNVPDNWEALAYLRLGRLVKYMRRASAQGYIPISLDSVNTNLCSALSLFDDYSEELDDLYLYDIAKYGLSLEVVDPIELENALSSMSWDDVLHARKKILPKVSVFRRFVIKSLQPLQKSRIPQEEIKKFIEELQKDFESRREELADEWEKLRIASILKGGGAVGAGSLGLSIMPSMTGTWAEILVRMISLGLVSVATLTPEIKALIPAKKKYLNHPLFFTTMFPRPLK